MNPIRPPVPPASRLARQPVPRPHQLRQARPLHRAGRRRRHHQPGDLPQGHRRGHETTARRWTPWTPPSAPGALRTAGGRGRAARLRRHPPGLRGQPGRRRLREPGVSRRWPTTGPVPSPPAACAPRWPATTCWSRSPATAAGVRAIETLTAEGVSINVTLMFSSPTSRRWPAPTSAASNARRGRGIVPRALGGKRLPVALGQPDRQAARRDRHPEALALRGKAGVALARQAYQRYLARFHGRRLRPSPPGARPQSMLWASTGTRTPAYPDLMYVEPLIGPEPSTPCPTPPLAAFIDHGNVTAATLSPRTPTPPRPSPRWRASGSTWTCWASACSRTAWPSSPPPSASCSNSPA